LPETLRFSRAIVVFGALLAFVFIAVQRFLLVKAGLLLKPLDASGKPHILIAATPEEYRGVEAFLGKKGFGNRIIGRVGINGKAEGAIAHFETLSSITKMLQAKELIFCAGTLSYKKLIGLTEKQKGRLKYRYHAFGSCSIVGSDTSTASGEILSAETAFSIAKAGHRRLKRLIDICAALYFLLTYPLQVFFVYHPVQFFINCLKVLAGRGTWVGYSKPSSILPALRHSVLAPNGRKHSSKTAPTENGQLLDYWYARNYEPLQDLKTIFHHYPELGSEKLP
jgi:O-antigen biosynthesis protein